MTERQRGLRLTHTNPEVQKRITSMLEAQRTQLVPIFFRYSSDVQSQFAQAAVLGVQEALTASGQNRQLVLIDSPKEPPAVHSADRFVTQAYSAKPLESDFGGQVDSDEIVRLLVLDQLRGGEDPRLEVLLTASDMTKGNLRFAYGNPQTEFSAIFSIKRFLDGDFSEEMLRQMFRRLARQQVGHMFGLPDPDRGMTTVDRLGEHCTNICTMRQALSIQEFAGQTQEELERTEKRPFCADCQIDLFNARARYQPLPPAHTSA